MVVTKGSLKLIVHISFLFSFSFKIDRFENSCWKIEWAHLVFLMVLVFHSYNADAQPETISDPTFEAKLLSVGCIFGCFLSFYLFFWSVYTLNPSPAPPIHCAALSSAQSSTSALLYSTVKELKIGKATLECVKICLNEFQHCDKIRLLLKCDHIFHTGCIDLRNLNCPICRSKQTHKGSCFRDFNPYNRVTTTAWENNTIAVLQPHEWTFQEFMI